MGWLLFIATIVSMGIAARSTQGTRMFLRLWIVASVLWIALWYLSVAGHMGKPGYMSFRATTEWALIPPIALLGLFGAIRWIVAGASR